MMRMKTKPTGLSHMNGGGGGGDSRRSESDGGEWEMRPGGMLVQKRSDSEQNRAPPPMIRVRVKFSSVYHEVNISSQATFGELKKMLSGPTGLHPEDQKLLFKKKERDSKTFLDIVGVKDRSKIVLIEDPISQEKRYIEMRKKAIIEKVSKSISEISVEVDRLAAQVSNLELVISKGGKVVEKDVSSLTELLMNQLLKLEGIIADGDVKLQRKMQVTRVQKYIETLDMLKIKNSSSMSIGTKTPKQETPIQQQKRIPIQSNGYVSSPNQHQSALRNSIGPLLKQTQAHQAQPARHSPSGSVVITTQWETFDVDPPPHPTATVQPKFNWDLL